MLPVENSSTGSIRQVYDLLAQYNYYVVGECQVKVEHCLMAPARRGAGGHSDGLLPRAGGDAVREVSGRPPGLAAGAHLGHRRLGQAGGRERRPHRRRHLLPTGRQDLRAAYSGRGVNYNAMNHTRFVVVSPVLELRPGRNKISAVFRLPHQSGSPTRSSPCSPSRGSTC